MSFVIYFISPEILSQKEYEDKTKTFEKENRRYKLEFIFWMLVEVILNSIDQLRYYISPVTQSQKEYKDAKSIRERKVAKIILIYPKSFVIYFISTEIQSQKGYEDKTKNFRKRK